MTDLQTLDQIMDEQTEYLSDGLLQSRLSNIRKFEEKYYIIFSKKEADILRSHIDSYVDCCMIPDLESKNYNLTEIEKSEFRSKLEKLGI